MAFRKLFTTFNDKHLEAVWHELNRRIQAAIDSTSGAASIVYRQGAQTGGGVYGTWPETVAAAAAIPGVKTVFVDDSLGAPIVGAGLWNLGGYTIMRGRQRGAAGGKCPLSCVDGARLIGVFEFRALRITSASTQPVVTSEDVQASNTGGNPTYVCGHCFETLVNTGNTLARCLLHFN